MKNNIIKSIKGILFAAICALLAAYISVSVCIPCTTDKNAAAETTAVYMDMETEALPFDGGIRRSSGNAQIYGNGNFMDALA